MKRNVRLGKALKEEWLAIVVKIRYTCTVKEYDDIVNDLVSTLVQVHHWLFHKSNV